MFDFFKRKMPRDREGMRADFRSVMAELAAADAVRRAAVGEGLNILTTAFVARFSSSSSFQTQPRAEQMQYLKSLITAADGLSVRDPWVALGFRLYAMYVAALMENDKELLSEIGKQLASLSREGDFGL